MSWRVCLNLWGVCSLVDIGLWECVGLEYLKDWFSVELDNLILNGLNVVFYLKREWREYEIEME